MATLIRLIRMIVSLAILLVLLAGVLWAVYMDRTGRVVTGTVIAKREAILMLGGDAFRHTFELTYENRSLDGYCGGTHDVDAAFYRNHPVGSAVRLRCPAAFGMAGHLQDVSTPWFESDELHAGELTGAVDLAILGIAAVLGWMAYRGRSKALGVTAAALLGICFPSCLLAACGVVVFPALFWAARLNPGKNYGLLLLATMSLCAVAVYVHVPQPAPIPPDQVRNGIGTVRQVHVVDEIWSSTAGSESVSDSHAVGQKIGPRYRMIELEFSPAGANESMRGLDRIDLDTMPGLRAGSVVPIVYSAIDPESVRIVGAARNYASQLVILLLSWTYGAGALMAFVVVPLLRAANKRWQRVVSDTEAVFTRAAESSQWQQLPDDDPRRKAMERAFAALRRGQSALNEHGVTDRTGLTDGASRHLYGERDIRPPSLVLMTVAILVRTIFHPRGQR